MQVKIICNNYITGICKKQLNYYIDNIITLDRYHKQIIFNVKNEQEIKLIEKISTYKSIKII